MPSGMERTLGNEFPVPLLKLSRNRDRETAKSFILSEVIKSVGINFLPAVLIGDRKQFFLVSRQVLYLKKNHVRLRTDSILQCLFLRFSTCCYGVIYRSLGGKTTTKTGDAILSLRVNCQILSEKRLAATYEEELFF